MQAYVPGQRWMSDTEPDLGLGLIQSVESRRVTLHFPASAQTRIYAMHSAPLTRVRFNVGDQIQHQQGWMMTVREIEEEAGLLTYLGECHDGTEVVVSETELAPYLRLSLPKERLFAGQIDDEKWFRLRCAALRHQQRLARLPVRGLLGGRVDLIPHQLYIADEVSRRRAPRVLLADEVGLGKTIEAGSILHRLLLNDRVQRALVIVPDALLYQWLVEMLRRFNVRFSLIEREQFESRRATDPQVNPFIENNLILCGLTFLTEQRDVAELAFDANWDMLIVDEAHHLEWTPQEASPAYRLVEALARLTPSLLLLTATPEQLGRAGHFARLRLLDPQRFHDFDAFLQEEAGYQRTAACAEALLDEDSELPAEAAAQLEALLGDSDASAKQLLTRVRAGSLEAGDRQRLLNELIDRHGTGRVLFRNTRAAVQGFPQRREMLYSLPADDADPRLAWLVEHLRALAPERALLICRQAQVAIDLAESLRAHYGIHAALFHEGLSIVERDRAAAYFADETSGAPLLICSEIGSEGRNFQFVKHLILYDLPVNPDLLEQRIGRLDRIGQQHTVHVHVPYLNTPEETFWVRWYHEGLDAFEHTCPVGVTVLNALQAEYLSPLSVLARDAGLSDAIIARTRELRLEQLALLERGRDRLLELHSCRSEPAQALCEQIAAVDADAAVYRFMETVFDCYGVHFEDHSLDCWIARPSDHMYVTQFPALPEAGCTLTTRRDLALQREDVQFLTWDHPLVTGALDLILHSGEGNVTLCAVHLADLELGEILVEALFRLHCAAEDRLNAVRYLPPALLRVVVDTSGAERSADYDETSLAQGLEMLSRHGARQLLETYHSQIRQLIDAAEDLAESQAAPLREQSLTEMQTELGAEWRRLASLARVDLSIRQDELDALQDDITELFEALSHSRLQMEALRILFAY